jgi:hypothetical protein
MATRLTLKWLIGIALAILLVGGVVAYDLPGFFGPGLT